MTFGQTKENVETPNMGRCIKQRGGRVDIHESCSHQMKEKNGKGSVLQ